MGVELHLPLIPDVELVAAKAVEVVGRDLGMAPEAVESAAIATVEACLNALEHGGNSKILVRVDVIEEGGRRFLQTEVEDHGVGFDPEAVPGAGTSRVQGCVTKRGWGLTLIRELMDEVHVQSQPGMTLVRMRKGVGEAR